MIKNIAKAVCTAAAFYATLKLVDHIEKINLHENVSEKAKKDAINTAINSMKK